MGILPSMFVFWVLWVVVGLIPPQMNFALNCMQTLSGFECISDLKKQQFVKLCPFHKASVQDHQKKIPV
jgi:hypothetical protein